MMLRFITLIFTAWLVMTTYSPFAEGHEDQNVLLIVKMQNESVLPRHFRTTKDAFLIQTSPFPSRKGLDDLKVAGSGQFSEAALKFILEHLGNPKSLVIVDLRQEPHGFVNGSAVTWFIPGNLKNEGKNLEQIEFEESKLLQIAKKKKTIELHKILKKDPSEKTLPKTTAFPVNVSATQSEIELAQSLGLGYVRFPVTDHLRPMDEAVNDFVKFARNLPEDTWLLMHCLGGAGRTTTFMIMYDMMKNSKEVAYEDIINRHWYLGGVNLNVVSANPHKHESSLEKIHFLKDFYNYCKNNNDGFKQTWLDYLKTKP